MTKVLGARRLISCWRLRWGLSIHPCWATQKLGPTNARQLAAVAADSHFQGPSPCGARFSSLGQTGSSRGFASGGYPPHTKLEMPALSPTMSQGNISAWKKKEGEEIAAGDVLCEVETDKATMDWEAQDEGFLAKILVGDGAKDVPVGTLVAVVVEDEEQVGAFGDYSGDDAGTSEAPAASTSEKDGDDGIEQHGDEDEEDEEEEQSAGGASGDYPPHQVMGLPALSPTMSQGNIAAWKKQVGDEVAAGDSLAEIETDKATMDWESQEDGYVAAILVPDGAKDVPAGSPVLVFVEEQASVEAFKDYKLADAEGGEKPAKKAKKEKPKQEKKAAAPPKKEAKAPKAPPPSPKPSPGGRVAASPYARKLAAEHGVDVAEATPTGPNGRIVAADVQKLISEGGGRSKGEAPAAAGPTPATQDGAGEWTDEMHSNIRRITAQRLAESKHTIPHYYLTNDIQMDRVMELRAKLNEKLAPSGQKLSINDFIIKASALALRKVPDVNASWFPEYIRRYHNIDVTVAVQTPAGLMVPVLRDADLLGLAEVSAGVKALAAKAKEGKLKPDKYTGGTFTISNLGMFGISEFSAIVNPPQACILAVGATKKRVVAAAGGGFREAAVMTVTLSCDHRVVDGALGAQWLQAFQGCLQDPETMLL